jgi:hypothetical protein
LAAVGQGHLVAVLTELTEAILFYLPLHQLVVVVEVEETLLVVLEVPVAVVERQVLRHQTQAVLELLTKVLREAMALKIKGLIQPVVVEALVQ